VIRAAGTLLEVIGWNHQDVWVGGEVWMVAIGLAPSSSILAHWLGELGGSTDDLGVFVDLNFEIEVAPGVEGSEFCKDNYFLFSA
jgi:hypothetical protein